ncbi:MAG: trehalose-phosphatase [Deltaproteobacteria bacterium]|nr:trehalose-phosphatase [Deltaproteobacteria bacterium]
MRYLFAKENLEILDQFAWSNTLVGLDFDGTLAPIVDDPAWAGMRTSTRRLLENVAALYPCAIISGRAQSDVRVRLRGLELDALVGNHGLEPSSDSERCAKAVIKWLPVVEKRLGHLPGVMIENKTYSLAVHYRHSRRKKDAKRAILDCAKELDGVRLIGGKLVVNLVPRGAPHKGLALERLRDKLRCDTAIYVGDDETDEDVFMLGQPGRLLSIRVGAKAGSHAAYYLKDQLEIDPFLRLLAELRQARGRRAADK